MAPPVPVGDMPSVPGHGSGLDVSEFKMAYFRLTPSPAGKTENKTLVVYGGGGGGVYINGAGPGTQYQWPINGQGWGGGQGGTHKGHVGYGLVLLEIATTLQYE